MMKRLLVWILVITMIICACSYAEETVSALIDVKTLSDEELIACRDAVNEELADRGMYPTLHAGNYVVGKDIASGRYLIQNYGDDDNWNRAWAVTIYKTAESKIEYEKAYHEWLAAYNLADANKAAGNDYSYPADIDTSEYYEPHDISSNGSISISVEDGQLILVKKVYADEGYLAISKSAGLFMD